MEIFKKIRERKRRERIISRAMYTIAEVPAVYRWISGDDTAEEELKALWKDRPEGKC